MLKLYPKVLIAVVAVILAALIVGAALIFLPKRNSGNVGFKIEKGQSLGAIASSLTEQHLVVSRHLFVAYVRLTGNERKIQAGRYVLPSKISIRTLVYLFSHGLAESDDIVVKIPEGNNLADIDQIFYKAGLTKAGDLLGPELLKHEGYFFPDTYRLEKGRLYKASEISGWMQDNFAKKTSGLTKGQTDAWRRVVIVASILEKEVKSKDDMRLVAGIIEKRLSLKMPLQVDAAVAYGVCYPKFLAKKYCDVSLANIVDNLALDSRYNTYRTVGLPVGPISNPGLNAIEAALSPLLSDYLYYLTTKDGKTIFSKTSQEHLEARRRYLHL